MEEPGSTLRDAVLQAADPMQMMQRVVDQALGLIPRADGALIALQEGDRLAYVCGSGRLAEFVGLMIDGERSLSGLSMRTREVLRSDDTSSDVRVDARAVHRLGVGSTVCVPLLSGDAAFGVLNVSAVAPFAFTETDAVTLRSLSEFVGVVVGAAQDLRRVTTALAGSDEIGEATGDQCPANRFVARVLNPDSVDRYDGRQRVERVMTSGFSMVFQPIFDLETRVWFGVEGLARFPGDPSRTPDRWFAEAHAVGLGVDLELAAIAAALRQQPRLPSETVLAVNAGPRAIADPRLLDLLARCDARRVVVELTEHVEVVDYGGLREAMTRIRESGARLAIDDTGAGISSLAHILRLGPEFIKLDRALTSSIDRDPVRRALAASLVSFAADTGPTIIAEGIETAEELTALRQLGIRLGQGFHLAMPRPLAGTALVRPGTA